jgi:hypothetical protein
MTATAVGLRDGGCVGVVVVLVVGAYVYMRSKVGSRVGIVVGV